MKAPYKMPPFFDEISLPASIRSAHSTKPGVWGLLRVVKGEVSLVFQDNASVVQVTPDNPATIPPEVIHHVDWWGRFSTTRNDVCSPPKSAQESHHMPHGCTASYRHGVLAGNGNFGVDSRHRNFCFNR